MIIKINILKSLFLGIILLSIKTYSQKFYVNTINIYPGIPPSNSVYKLDISSPSETSENFCLPTVTANEAYTDIAIDKDGYFYYVTSSGLLYKQNETRDGCEFLGDFSSNINSLTADSGNYLYATGSLGILYRYDMTSGVFSAIGNIPADQIPGGDLFFYENRLFLTTTGGIMEVNMVNPLQSCPFISLGIQYSSLYAGFSINYGTYSKAYVINNVSQNSVLYELDMVNHQIGSPIRTYNHRIYGATSSYSLTSSNSECTPTALNTQETRKKSIEFSVVNPSKNIIICKTDIERKQIASIRLYDNTGRLVRDFIHQNNLEHLDISGVSAGTYLLSMTTKKGETYTKKIIVVM
ncbi:T9SS type A sorting domain-containing protein [Chryseobacterium sp. SSA4.19]|uniref:T9SS type A sorting domain-containing protein n=1 Tax=Chryseobacterium sp. SSA4.19 TaxID=2919915 RepID=UPI001F4DEC0F|nr:T9SS type A sorting domain-containing protein [Chryseobacterium sp. SSA4.19]MCJ8155013.1 T9SS type A sorting domain-containing protein [Chryseobacterium sp. SSA4.19]